MLARFISALLFISSTTFGQSQETKDSLTNEICKTIKATKDQSDSILFFGTLKEHLVPFLLEYPEKKRKEIGKSIYLRLQRNCIEFKTILERVSPPSKDWEVRGGKPIIHLNEKKCKQFLGYKKYKYLESNGDTVNLQIENGYWIDHFKDGTFSKLKFYRISDCEFEIEFIESNNEIRKNFSKVDDKYRYQIIDKKENYYNMSLEIVGTNGFYLFKIYY